MKKFIWPLLCLLFVLLLTSNAYNSKECDDKPSETGPCRAFFPMWRFIKETRQCEPFIYGGCQGTRNMFDDEEECKRKCAANST
ncbi:kunitz-type serine protease inhibitor HMGS2 [Drosophila grimshawi]|uniref:kunitz-type serine protease inhibitor HMGS2 n=1 Tax=Drosophila grimshawi TaxID=7222 RepID=UPI000C870C89|nr:kunitz-type serine protease inhibitor HMGS2 [Drosophila grimshawi]